MATIGSPLYFFSVGIFSLLLVYQFFIWLGRREELINLAFSVLSLSYIGVITLSRMDLLEQQTLRHLFPISITMIISIVIPFIGYVFLKIHELKKFFIYSSAGVQIFSIFMIVYYFLFGISVPLTAVYYAYIAIWPTIGSVLIVYYFIHKKQFKDLYNTFLFIGYFIIMISMVVQLIPTIIDAGMGSNFLIIQSFPLVAIILLLSFLSSKKFNREYKELVELKTLLEIKVDKRTKALQEADRQKTDFFINFAHEMKTPLLLIQNYLHHHIEHNGTSDALYVVKENVDTLTRNMANVLDFEKLEKKLPLYDHHYVIDVGELLERKMQIYELPVKQAGISASLKTKRNCLVRIDPFALDRIFNNLLDNAVRYGNAGGTLAVELNSSNSFITLTVFNTGAGIPKDSLSKIFEPYYQLSHKKRNIQGIGVGLHIVKRILDDVGGSIIVESAEDEWTRFTLSFKRVRNEEAVKLPEFPEPPGTYIRKIELQQPVFNEDRKSVFIVEDNISHLAFLQSSFEDEYNVFFAVNGREALNKLPEMPVPDVILCDVMMDELDGFDFYSTLTGIEKFSGIPFIFISALAGEDEKLRALASGAIDFISKPYGISELKNKVKSIINLDEIRDHQQLSKIEKKIIGALHNETQEETQGCRMIENCAQYRLSPREIEIVNLIMEGYEHKEIVYSLEMTMNTLKTHMKNIYSKCNVQNKIELINKIRQ